MNVWATKDMMLKEKVHHGDGYLSNGTHTVMMYQHSCGECLVHLGIHVVVVVLYKLVISSEDHLGAYRDELRPHFKYIYIYNYTFQYMYYIKTQINVYFLTDLQEHIGSMGILDYRI